MTLFLLNPNTCAANLNRSYTCQKKSPHVIVRALRYTSLENRLEAPSGEQPVGARRFGVATVTVPLDIME